MPPTNKTVKAIAAELKKRNTVKAKEIVEQLKRDSQAMASSMETTSSVNLAKIETHFDLETVKSKSESTVEVIKQSKRPYKKKTDRVEVKKVNTVKAKEIVGKLKRKSEKTGYVKGITSTAKTIKAAVNPMIDSNETVKSGGGSIIDLTVTSNSEKNEHVATLPKNSTLQEAKSVQIMGSSSMVSKNVISKAKVTSEKSIVPPKTGSSNGATYQYEIDCSRVADSIDVIDLQRHLELYLKINGEKNNLGSTVTICCEGQKVVIRSRTFFPKKSLRFLSKKFLKKNWNIQVASKNIHSYEYRYVGTP